MDDRRVVRELPREPGGKDRGAKQRHRARGGRLADSEAARAPEHNPLADITIEPREGMLVAQHLEADLVGARTQRPD